MPGSEGGFVLISDAVKVGRPNDVPYPAAVAGSAEAAAPEAESEPQADAAPEAPAADGDAEKKD